MPQPVEFFITPRAEYLVLPYWRAAVRDLLALPQVRRVTVQTNLSFDLAAFLGDVDASKLALWTTYHPSEVPERELEVLADKWRLLQERGVPFSVGIVGTHENLTHVQRLRRLLDPGVYLWVNAYQREQPYYTAEELEAIRGMDRWFDLNNQYFPSRGRPCTPATVPSTSTTRATCAAASSSAPSLATCSATAGSLTRAAPCPKATCHCYVGQMHIVELGFRRIYGENLAARIPLAHSNGDAD